MAEISITTTQNVRINFELAPVSSRIHAFVIDNLIKLGYYLIVWKIYAQLSTDDDWESSALFILIGLPAAFYTLLFEYFLDGQTPGKKILRIRVVKIDGYQAGFFDLLSRWVMRIIDIYATLGIAGLISMGTSKKNQRLGDVVAGTSVINLNNSHRFDQTIWTELGKNYIPTFTQIARLNDNDMRIIKNNLDKARRTMDHLAAERLSQKIKSVLEIETNMPDFTFLETVLQDYNYYTRNETAK